MFELSLNTPWPLAGIGWKLLGNWQVMVGKKFKKSITLFWKRQEKNLLSYSETYLERSRTINAAKSC